MSTFFESKKAPALQQAAVVKFDLLCLWHPRFRFVKDFEVPVWLQAYSFAHFGSDNIVEEYTKAAHLLFHTMLDNLEDRKHMALALSIGETIALVRQDESNCGENKKDITAVAALTYVQIGSTAVVTFLAVDSTFQDSGMGTQLLVLLGKTLLHRGRKNVQFLLNTSQGMNPNAWRFYTKRGFKLLGNSVNKDVDTFFMERRATTLCPEGTPSNGLSWINIVNFAHCFQIGKRTVKEVSLLFMLDPSRKSNPESGMVEDEMVYAQLPAKLSPAAANWCGNDLVLLQHSQTFESATKSPDNLCVGMFDGLPKNEMVVSWRSRVNITPGAPMYNPALSLVIAWLQHDKDASIWKRLTLVPPCIMTPLSTMHILYSRYMASFVYKEYDIKDATFHPVHDNHRFIRDANTVVTYIRGNPSVFSKPFIAMCAESDQMDWTCFISVNAGSIGEESQLKVREKVCGFLHYDPIAEDTKFRATPVDGDDPFLFFLTLAHCILKDHDGNHFFENVAEFEVFFEKARHSFGTRYSRTLQARPEFSGDASFVQLALPEKYPLRLFDEQVCLSKLGALMFLFDFCVQTAEKTFVWALPDGINLKPLIQSPTSQVHAITPFYTLGSYIGRRTKPVNRMVLGSSSNRHAFGIAASTTIKACLNSVIILMDRLAITVYGEIRKESEFYKKYLADRGRGGKCPGMMKVPPKEGRFTDRSTYCFSWKPYEVSEALMISSPMDPLKAAAATATNVLPASPIIPSPVATASYNTRMQILTESLVRKPSLPPDQIEAIVQDMKITEDLDDSPGDEKSPPRQGLRKTKTRQEPSVELALVAVAMTKDASGQCSVSSNESNNPQTPSNKQKPGPVTATALSGETMMVAEDDANSFCSANSAVNFATCPMEGDLDDILLEVEDEIKYEGFEEGHANATSFDPSRSARQLGLLPPFEAFPVGGEKETADAPRKRKRNRRAYKRSFLPAVDPMNLQAKHSTNRAAGGVRDQDVQIIEDGTLCVAGDACKLPIDRRLLTPGIDRLVACARCSQYGHCLCLHCRRKKWYCLSCISHLRDEEKRKSVANSSLCKQIALPPPPELLLQEKKLIRPPNITAQMKECLDRHLKARNFPTEDEMRKKIDDYNEKLRELKSKVFTDDTYKALHLEGRELKSLTREWNQCYQTLCMDYLRSTRCIVKEMRWDKKTKSFIAIAEWEEEAVDLRSRRSCLKPVVMRQEIPLKKEWVKENFKEDVWVFLQTLPKMAHGKFMPVPEVSVLLDTRQISHFKWGTVENEKGRRQGCWIVKYAGSAGDTEIMDERELLNLGTFSQASLKSLRRNKKWFHPDSARKVMRSTCPC